MPGRRKQDGAEAASGSAPKQQTEASIPKEEARKGDEANEVVEGQDADEVHDMVQTDRPSGISKEHEERKADQVLKEWAMPLGDEAPRVEEMLESQTGSTQEYEVSQAGNTARMEASTPIRE